ATPEPATRANDLRLLRSRGGSVLEFDDGPQPKVRITMEAGHQVVLDTAAQEVTVRHGLGCVVKLTATSVEISGTLDVTVTAAMVNVNAAVSTFSGMVKCTTLVADTMVMSPAYTPGAGNIW
ncbi:hypothetical protein, partial [Nonomuraea zeae]